MGCCDPLGCQDFFGRRTAESAARRYRSRGPDRTGRRVVEALTARGITGATVLEIGGGVGEIHLELLRRGAARATNLELADAWDAPAARLAAAAGVSDRVERRRLDVATAPDDVEPADVVVLHRVVCCYPDHEALLGAAADHARRLLVFSHPPRNVVSRAGMATQNRVVALLGKDFRVFAHPPDEMERVVRGRGMDPFYRHAGLVWRVLGMERRAA